MLGVSKNEHPSTAFDPTFFFIVESFSTLKVGIFRGGGNAAQYIKIWHKYEIFSCNRSSRSPPVRPSVRTFVSNTFQSFKTSLFLAVNFAPLHLCTLQCCNNATLQLFNIHYNIAALQLFNIANLQLCNIATFQHSNITTIATLQLCNIATLQPCNIATLRLCNSATLWLSVKMWCTGLKIAKYQTVMF